MSAVLTGPEACEKLDQMFWLEARSLTRSSDMQEDVVQEMALAVLEAGHNKAGLGIEEYEKIAKLAARSYVRRSNGYRRKHMEVPVGGIHELDKIETEGRERMGLLK